MAREVEDNASQFCLQWTHYYVSHTLFDAKGTPFFKNKADKMTIDREEPKPHYKKGKKRKNKRKKKNKKQEVKKNRSKQ